jgi:hypothetical protein
MDFLLKTLLQKNQKDIVNGYDMIVLYVHAFIFEHLPENKARKNV